MKSLGRIIKKRYDGLHTLQAFASANKIPVYTNGNSHNTKTRSAAGNHIAGSISFSCQPAHRVGKIPKIFKGLLLHFCEQCIICNYRKLIGRIYFGDEIYG